MQVTGDLVFLSHQLPKRNSLKLNLCIWVSYTRKSERQHKELSILDRQKPLQHTVNPLFSLFLHFYGYCSSLLKMVQLVRQQTLLISASEEGVEPSKHQSWQHQLATDKMMQASMACWFWPVIPTHWTDHYADWVAWQHKCWYLTRNVNKTEENGGSKGNCVLSF